MRSTLGQRGVAKGAVSWQWRERGVRAEREVASLLVGVAFGPTFASVRRARVSFCARLWALGNG